MQGIFDAVFVNPSPEALAPIIMSLVAGTVLSFFRRLVKIGMTILVIGALAFVAYLLWHNGTIALPGLSPSAAGLPR